MSTSALFIYWHTEPDRAATAEAAARAFQTQAQARHGGLQARLYRRSDGDRQRVTLMETYASANELPSTLADEADRALKAWATGGRHVERFEPAD